MKYEDKAFRNILKGEGPEKKIIVPVGIDKEREQKKAEEKERKERLSKIFQNARMPVWCPECEHPMKHRLDRKFWAIHGKCFNCVIEEQSRMRAEGKWKEYEKKVMNSNRLSYFIDLEQFLESILDSLKNPEFINEFGEVERWSGLDIEKVREDIQEDLKEVRLTLKEIRDGIGSFETNS